MNPIRTLMFLAVVLALAPLALLAVVVKPLAPALTWLFERWADDMQARFALAAVVNTKSTTITNLDAAQVVRAKAFANGAPIKEWIETLETVNGDSIASVYRFFRVPSWIRVSDLILDSDDIGTTTIADFGLYDTSANGGAVVDADFFASAVSLKDGALANSNITHESGVIDAANYGKRIWEQLGLSADPQKYYDVCATLTAAADAAGTMTLRLKGTEV